MKKQEKIDELKRQLANNPQDCLLWNKLGNLYLSENMFDQSLDAFEFSLAIDPHNEEALLKKHHLLWYSPEPKLRDEAKRFLLDYYKKHPESMTVKVFSEIKNNTNVKLDSTGTHTRIKKDSSIKEPDWDLLKDPNTPMPEYSNILSEYIRNRSDDMAIKILHVLQEVHPEDLDLDLFYGQIMVRTHEPEIAKKHFNKALYKAFDRDEKDFCHSCIGDEYFYHEDYKSAFHHYSQIREGRNMKETRAFAAACCLYLDYRTYYFWTIELLHPEVDEEDFTNICKAFYEHLPPNIQKNEVEQFLYILYDRYNNF